MAFATCRSGCAATLATAPSRTARLQARQRAGLNRVPLQPSIALRPSGDRRGQLLRVVAAVASKGSGTTVQDIAKLAFSAVPVVAAGVAVLAAVRPALFSWVSRIQTVEWRTAVGAVLLGLAVNLVARVKDLERLLGMGPLLLLSCTLQWTALPLLAYAAVRLLAEQPDTKALGAALVAVLLLVELAWRVLLGGSQASAGSTWQVAPDTWIESYRKRNNIQPPASGSV